jgi:murein DD-endopeptidase MepM/ murein hydrolase activator NlpD
MSRLPKLPDTGTAHGQNYGANREGGRKHAGVDFDIRGNQKFFSRIGGTVTKVGYDPNGYGNYVDIYNDQLKVTERIAEGKTVLVKQGQKVSPGTPVSSRRN